MLWSDHDPDLGFKNDDAFLNMVRFGYTSGFQNLVGSGTGLNIKILNVSKIGLFFQKLIEQSYTTVLIDQLCRKKKVKYFIRVGSGSGSGFFLSKME